jgi:hypothetical protein
MPTTGTVLVENLMISFSENGTTHNLISCQTDASLSISRTILEKICKGQGASTGKDYGKYTWTLSGGGYFAFDSAYGGVDIADVILEGVKVTARFTTDVTGDTYYHGSLVLSSVNINSASGGNAYVMFDWTGEGDGDLTKATVAA